MANNNKSIFNATNYERILDGYSKRHICLSTGCDNSRSISLLSIKKAIVFIVFAVSIIFITSACMNPATGGKYQEQKDGLSIYPEQAFFTYISGDVKVNRGGNIKEAALDYYLTRDDVVRTGDDSSCEIQFGDSTLMSMEENTIVSMGFVMVEREKMSVSVKIDGGSALFKVKKLLGVEDFNVKTNAAVFAVRGTSFGVTVSKKGESILFVREGRIAALPQAINLQAIKNQLSGLPGFEQKVESVIWENALNVEEQKQLIVTEENAFEAERAFNDAKRELYQLQTKAQISEAEINRISGLVGAKTLEAVSKFEPPVGVSQKNIDELSKIDKFRAVKVNIVLPEKGAFATPQNNTDTSLAVPEKETSGKNTFSDLAILTDPIGADIIFDNKNIGVSPKTITSVSVGMHKIFLSKPGYTSLPAEISVSRIKDVVSFKLAAETLEAIALSDVIDIIGIPEAYIRDGKPIDKSKAIDSYEIRYDDRYSFEIVKNIIVRLTFGKTDDYTYHNEVGIGSTRAHVEKILGKPDEASENREIYDYEKKGLEFVFNADTVERFSITKLKAFSDLVPKLMADPGQEDKIWDFYHRINRLREKYGVE